MPAIRNAILLILANKTSKELLNREGKEQLAQEIMREAVRPMGIELATPEPITPAAAEHATSGAASAAAGAPAAKPKAAAPPPRHAQPDPARPLLELHHPMTPPSSLRSRPPEGALGSLGRPVGNRDDRPDPHPGRSRRAAAGHRRATATLATPSRRPKAGCAATTWRTRSAWCASACRRSRSSTSASRRTSAPACSTSSARAPRSRSGRCASTSTAPSCARSPCRPTSTSSRSSRCAASAWSSATRRWCSRSSTPCSAAPASTRRGSRGATSRATEQRIIRRLLDVVMADYKQGLGRHLPARARVPALGDAPAVRQRRARPTEIVVSTSFTLEIGEASGDDPLLHPVRDARADPRRPLLDDARRRRTRPTGAGST